ncbi:MAG TPA: SAF domain-containing protein, partial [Actinomycetota bacterium]|nr:SAF domain-containing protein [Actinomycetota bacterium]
VFVPPLGPTAPGGPAGPGPAPVGRVPHRRLSTGHVVMIVAGLVAALLTYAILRQAGGQGSEVLVAAQGISAGQTVTAGMFTTTTIKAPDQVIASGMVTPGQESSVVGEVATVAIAKGQVIEANEFSGTAPQPPRAAIQLDPGQIPGGASSVKVGSTIDLVGVTAQGVPVAIPGLQVLKVPATPAGSGTLSGTTSSVQIVVAVPSMQLMEQVAAVTQGKFEIRVTDPGAPSGSTPAPGGSS